MPPVPVPKPSIGGQAKQREIQREEELLSQIAEAKGPEAFFEYMKSQGMSDDDIQRMLSGDQQVMEEALARKVFVCPLAMPSPVPRISVCALESCLWVPPLSPLVS